MKKSLFIMLLFAAFNTLAQQKQSGVYYQIFVRSFNDANGDGIGDINGITQKLDYLKTLGISGLWLTPVHPSPTYHKYDVTDYKAIDQEYGTLADYKKLVNEAHQRGIKILLDLVVNHTSSEHPWFKASTGDEGMYRDYYVWSDTARTHGWYSNPKNPQEKFYAFFWERMPDLNFDNPQVRKEIIDAGKFWLQEVGIDGYRLDAAQHVYDAEDVVKNNEWWAMFRSELRKVKQDVFLIGEVWNKDSIVATYLKTSLDACFNFDLSWAIQRAVKDTNATGFTDKLASIHNLYRSYNASFTDAIFISNHDQDRYRSSFDGDMAKTRQAFTMLMTLPGVPFIYYGEEIGMLGKFPDEYRREPFLWTGSASTNTYWEKPRYTNPQTVTPLDAQMNDINSHYHFCKRMIAIRNNNPILSEGELMRTELVAQSKTVIAYVLVWQGKKALVVHHVGQTPQQINIPAGGKELYSYGVSGKKLRTFAPNSSLVILLK